MARPLLCISDYDNAQVCLTEQRWTDHILQRHPVLENGEYLIKVALRRPVIVTGDRGYGDRKRFYRKLYVPGVRQNCYLKVVVEYDETDRGDVYGEVITAFPSSSVHPDEERLWPSKR